MIFVDSSVWIDYFGQTSNLQTEKLDQILSVERILIGDLVLIEVLQGYRDRKEFAAAFEVLRSFEIITVGGPKVCIQAARNHGRLRSIGFTVRKSIDTIIATRCIESGYRLLHNDRDFVPFEKYLGLKCVV